MRIVMASSLPLIIIIFIATLFHYATPVVSLSYPITAEQSIQRFLQSVNHKTIANGNGDRHHSSTLILHNHTMSTNTSNNTLLLPLPIPAETSSTTTRTMTREQRLLFENLQYLNKVLSGMILIIDDFHERSGNMQLWGSNVVCRNTVLTDIKTEYRMSGDKKDLDMPFKLLGVSMDCHLDWRYKWNRLSGSGKAKILASDSSVNATLHFSSSPYSFSSVPPSSVGMPQCTSDIQISDIEFYGSAQAMMLNLMEALMRDSIEKEITGKVCVEMGSLAHELHKVIGDLEVIFGEYLQDMPPSLSDVLYAENNLVPPEGDVTLWELAELDAMLTKYLPSSSFDKGDIVTWLLKQWIPHLLVDGHVIEQTPESLPSVFPRQGVVFEMKDDLIDAKMKITSVRIRGFETYSLLKEPLKVVGNYTLETLFQWEALEMEMDADLILNASLVPGFEPATPDEHYHVEHLTISTNITNLTVGLYLLLGVDQTQLFNTQLGMMFNFTSSHLLSCLLPSLNVVDVVGMTASFDKMSTPTLEGFVGEGVERIYRTGFNAMFDMYVGSVMGGVNHFFAKEVRSVMGDLLANEMTQLREDSGECRLWTFPDEDGEGSPGHNPEDGETEDEGGWLNFADFLLAPHKAITAGGQGTQPYGTVGQKAMALLNENVFQINPKNNKTADALNDFLASSSLGSSLTLGETGEFDFKRRLKIGEFKANLHVKLYDARIDHLNTFGTPLSLLQPIDAHQLNNTATVGVGTSLQGSFKLYISLVDDTGDINVSNLLDVGVDVDDLTTVAALLIQMKEDSLMRFPVKDIWNEHCWLATIPAPELDEHGVKRLDSPSFLSLEQWDMSLKQLRVSVSCENDECTSPQVEQLTKDLSSPPSITILTRAANLALNYVTYTLQDPYVSTQLNRWLSTAPKQCPHHPSYDPLFSPEQVSYQPFPKPRQAPEEYTFLIVMGGVVAAVILLIGVVTIVVQCIVRWRHYRWLKTLSDEQKAILRQTQAQKRQRHKELNAGTTAMITSPAIPCVIRWGMPLVILGNVAFFLSGHLSLGATVNIGVNIAGQVFVIKNFFEFSMARSVMDMWKAGAKELAILMSIFSGLWPYTKQILSLLLWILPPCCVSVSTRESTYLWLDCLGKWSFVDIFVLVMTVVSFRISIENPLEIVVGDSVYGLDLMVVPVWGLYANMIAQIISQFSSHLMIHYHRRIVRQFDLKKGYEKEDDRGRDERLYQHEFRRTGVKEGKGLVLRHGVIQALMVLAIAVALLVIAGCLFPSFSLQTLGLVGIAVESGQQFQQANKSYDIFVMVKILMEQAHYVGGMGQLLGMTTLSVVLIGTVLVVPLTILSLLLYRWFAGPQSIASFRSRRRNAILIESLSAWQYVEVYILSIVIASWQLGPVSEFMINTYCGALDNMFASLVYYGVLDTPDAQCFRINANIEPGTWVLLTSAVLLAGIGHFVGKAAQHQEEDDREDIQKEQQQSADTVEKIAEDGAVPGDIEKACKQDGSKSRIAPVSPRYSDYYRWFLKSENQMDAASRRLGFFSYITSEAR